MCHAGCVPEGRQPIARGRAEGEATGFAERNQKRPGGVPERRQDPGRIRSVEQLWQTPEEEQGECAGDDREENAARALSLCGVDGRREEVGLR